MEIDAVLIDWTTYSNAFRRGVILLPLLCYPLLTQRASAAKWSSETDEGVNILQAITDRNLFAAWLKDHETWAACR
jgi:hypothetical protein